MYCGKRKKTEPFVITNSKKGLKIEFTSCFNQNPNIYIDEISKCKTIIFGSEFNQPINDLPNTIESITFGKNFNQPINNLPLNLKILNIEQGYEEGKFNNPVDNLPLGLGKLIISSESFNQSLDNLPSGLKYLEINSIMFNQPIDNLPNGLVELKITGDFNQPIDNLPDSLENLDLTCDINYSVDNLPNNLVSLKIGLNSDFDVKINNLPQNLMFLQVGHNYVHPFDNLNEGLEYLVIGDTNGTEFSHFDFVLPKSLKTLCIVIPWSEIEKFIDKIPNGIFITNDINSFDSDEDDDFE
jgi:hypothetical protein